MKYMENPKVFSSRDLYLSATLIALKFPLQGINLEYEGMKARAIGYFSFEDTPEIREARIKYNRGELLVEPRLFVNTMQSLKAEITNMSRNMAMGDSTGISVQ